MFKDKRMVVVGYGMGAYHSQSIDTVPGLVLHGVCDILPEKCKRAAQEHPGIKTYDHISQVLKDKEVDCVSVVIPHNQHAEMAISVMNAGKNAITDKAMCLSVKEAKAMIAARDRNKVLLSTFHNRRWDSDFVTVRKLLENGAIGQPYHISNCTTFEGKSGGWRSRREEMGGWLFDWGAHTIDQLLVLAQSRAKSVYAFTHYRTGTTFDVEDYVNLTITFESGLTATTVVSYLHHIPMERWHIIGDKGALKCDDFGAPVRVRSEVGGIWSDTTVPLIPTDWNDFYRNISDVLHGKAEPIVKPEQLVPQIAIAEAAYKSIDTGKVVQIG